MNTFSRRVPAVEVVAALAGQPMSQLAGYWMEAAARTLRSHRQDLDHARGQEGEGGDLDALSGVPVTWSRRSGPWRWQWISSSCSIPRMYLVIGYSAADDRLDPGHYDLLASEARLASLVAIAKGDVPTRHWFRLSRELTPVGAGAAWCRGRDRCSST